MSDLYYWTLGYFVVGFFLAILIITVVAPDDGEALGIIVSQTLFWPLILTAAILRYFYLVARSRRPQ